VKLLLYVFEQLSGLKINFLKNELLSIEGDNNVNRSFAEIFNCQVGMFPVKYLGVPVSAKRLRVIDWLKLEEKLGKKLDTWQGNSLFFCGRTVLINYNLSNMPIYHMSMFLLPKTAIKRMDKMKRKFFGRLGVSKVDLPWVKLIWRKYYSNGKLPGQRKRGYF
jgi:hypothetical protein